MIKTAKFKSLDNKVINRLDLDEMIMNIIVENKAMSIKQVADKLQMQYKDIKMCMLTMVDNYLLEKIRCNDLLKYRKINHSMLAELLYPVDLVEKSFKINSRITRHK